MRSALVVVVASLALSASMASASPMEDTSLGGAVFTGPTQGHASSFFVNPAALGLSGTGWHLHVGGSARLNSIYVDRDVIGLDGQQEAAGSVKRHTISPGGIIAAYFSVREDAARFGLAFSTPTLERFPEGRNALGYHSEGGQLLQGMLTMAGSYRIGGSIIFGIGFSLGYSTLNLKFSRDSVLDGGSDSVTGINSDCGGLPCGYQNPLARERYDVDVGSQAPLQGLFALKNISASIGAVIKVPGQGLIGIGYVALPGAFGTLALSGKATVEHAPRDGGQTEQAIAEIGFRMAQMAFLGYRRPLVGDFDVVGDLRWQDWSRHDQFDIRLIGSDLGSTLPEWMPRYRGMQDVWRLSAGVESNDRQAYRVGARLRLETGAVHNAAISPLQVAGESATLATGAELRLAEHFVVNLGYELTWFPGHTIDKSAFDPREHVACVDSGYDFDTCSAARDGRTFATAAGSYQHLQHGMVLSLRYDWL